MGHLRTVLNHLKVYTYHSVSFGIFAGETSPNFQNEIMPTLYISNSKLNCFIYLSGKQGHAHPFIVLHVLCLSMFSEYGL